ncbi:50S ribosome-binding GTPase [Phormidium sp. LEGE 05292]|uniref:GTPase n=1 Tax=[Phormidium] sp. LEGE 05292 TaxID=767427 RepID=UPI0018803DB9|nr:GTPase [Phormidium sp. LEGE 05292]MBE9224108.1 50S ribosome-binding GTPase [Phormidium sp. LEGE 05292]
MYFQFNPPSDSNIRASLIIDKLRTVSSTSTYYTNIFVTGRTGAGKTTLGNKLIGGSHFMPSSGRQDCTNEINLIKFVNCLQYFDLPGVCSNDRLENYNRAALNIEQIERFDDEDLPIVEKLTVADYSKSENPQRKSYRLTEFRTPEFEPDLIFYLIAPEKQFTRGDRKYLRDLLKIHRQVIYVLNMFVNKQSEKIFAATEANLIDAVTKIMEVHTSFFGTNSQPTIVPVNCWTGEGISELLIQSQVILGGEKGRLFEELIAYQQQKTPDEYNRQVNRELVRAFAYTASQKAKTGVYSCDQPLHKACHCLWDFLANLRSKAEQTSYFFGKDVSNLVNKVLSGAIRPPQQGINSTEEKISAISRGLAYIGDSIEFLNDEISTRIFATQEQAIELRDRQIESFKTDIQSRGEDITNFEQEISYRLETLNSLIASRDSLAAEIDSRIDAHNVRVDKLNSIQIELIQRRENLNSRVERWNSRLESYNYTVSRINNGYAKPNRDTIESLEQESDWLDEEKSKIKSKQRSLERDFDDYHDRVRVMETEEETLQRMIQQRTEKSQTLSSEANSIQQMLKQRSEKRKYLDDEVKFAAAILESFEEEFSSIDKRVNERISEINSDLEIIKLRLSIYQQDETNSIQDEITAFQEEVNKCVDRMRDFEQEIKKFQAAIEACEAKMLINKLVLRLIMQSTKYYFDETGDCEFKDSTADYFGKNGVVLLLSLAHSIVSGKDIESGDRALYNSILARINKLGMFPEPPTENNVKQFLELKIDSLFDESFNQVIRQAAL